MVRPFNSFSCSNSHKSTLTSSLCVHSMKRNHSAAHANTKKHHKSLEQSEIMIS